ncbi:type VI secretion system tube protein Hcp [Hafnia paralvei]|uniref:type VI secretion system tube protein Hcp n=1 Tax=Hafnia paralvei TaxID=546367 RepID=UPI001033729F|nr:type VI secretion system tube protein Hcp [Hafnia paralvei]TBL64533.1 hypothetical protein EYY97_03240 [Hafnia paralvei]
MMAVKGFLLLKDEQGRIISGEIKHPFNISDNKLQMAIEILSMKFDLSALACEWSGRLSGYTDFNNLTVLKPFDKSSVTLRKCLTEGVGKLSGVIDFFIESDNGKLVCYYSLEFKKAKISSCEFSSSFNSSEFLTEEVGFDTNEVKWIFHKDNVVVTYPPNTVSQSAPLTESMGDELTLPFVSGQHRSIILRNLKHDEFYYHVTKAELLPLIQENGLTPTTEDTAKEGSTLHESRLTNGVVVFANKLAALLAKDDFMKKMKPAKDLVVFLNRHSDDVKEAIDCVRDEFNSMVHEEGFLHAFNAFNPSSKDYFGSMLNVIPYLKEEAVKKRYAAVHYVEVFADRKKIPKKYGAIPDGDIRDYIFNAVRCNKFAFKTLTLMSYSEAVIEAYNKNIGKLYLADKVDIMLDYISIIHKDSDTAIAFRVPKRIIDENDCMPDNSQVSAIFVTQAIDPKHLEILQVDKVESRKHYLDMLKGNTDLYGKYESLIGYKLRAKMALLH